MPRKRKEVCRKSILTKNGRTVIRVFVRESPKKGGKDYFTELLDSNAEPVVGVSTQEHRASNSSFLEDEVIDRVIARTVEKYEAKEYQARTKVDYVALVTAIPSEAFQSLCPPSWGAPFFRSALKFYLNNSVAVIQNVLDASEPTLETLYRAREAMLKIVESHQRRNSAIKEDSSGQLLITEARRFAASAQRTADRRIIQANILYQTSRVLLAEYTLPPIQIPRLVPIKYVPLERCKALPRDFLIMLAAICLSEIEDTALAVGALILMGSMLRPAEGCAPRYRNILDYGSYGVYAVRRKVDSESLEVVHALKSDAARRTIVIPAIAMHAIRRRKAHLAQCGLTEDEINNAFVVSRDDDPFVPANPNILSHYIKTRMDMLGCDDSFWEAVSLLMYYEPDLDEHGNVLADPTTYSLRRAGCSNLMNCAAAPRLSGEKLPLYTLVDLLMGHKLRWQDSKWKEWLNRPDNWPLVAQMLETIVLDPDHSAHPAFAGRDTKLFPEKICHACQRLYIPDGSEQCTITVQAHSTDDIVVRFPESGKASEYKQIVMAKNASSMPIVQEEFRRAIFENAINKAKKYQKKEKGAKDGQ